MQILNLPISLLERHKSSKSQKELLAFAIGIKCLYSNSVLTGISPKKVMSLFHVAHGKAKGLIEGAKQSDLFYFDEKRNYLKVNSFKDNILKKSKGGFLYKSDYCYKLEKDNFTIKALTKIITEILIKNAINAVDRNNFTKSNKNHCCVPLSQRKLGNIAGISRSQVSKITKKMSETKIITKKRARMECVISSVNDKSVSEWQSKTGKRKFILNPYDNSGWIIIPCKYSINNRQESDRFKNVIYTYKKRVESFNSLSNDYFTRMEH